MSDGWNTHAEAGARVQTAAWLHKLTFASVFLNGELRNFPFSLVRNHGSSERLTGRRPGVEVKKGWHGSLWTDGGGVRYLCNNPVKYGIFSKTLAQISTVMLLMSNYGHQTGSKHSKWRFSNYNKCKQNLPNDDIAVESGASELEDDGWVTWLGTRMFFFVVDRREQAWEVLFRIGILFFPSFFWSITPFRIKNTLEYFKLHLFINYSPHKWIRVVNSRPSFWLYCVCVCVCPLMVI